jgi:hypothetical protein
MAAQIKRTLRGSRILKGTMELRKLTAKVSKIMKHKPAVKKMKPKKK